MNIDISLKEGDSKEFLTSLNGLVAHLATEFSPKEVCVKRINRWFDHKWLKYLGNGLIPFPERGEELLGIDSEPCLIESVAMGEHFQDRLVAPPFDPGKIGYPYYWPQGEDGIYDGGIDQPSWPDISLLKYGSPHFQNRVASYTDSGIYTWFSSYTGRCGRASVMTYLVKDGHNKAWYASLVNQSGWKIEKVKGIKIETLEDWFHK